MTQNQEDKAKLPRKYRSPKGVLRLVTVGLPLIAIVVAILHLFHIAPFGFVLIPLEYLYFLMAAFLPLSFLWIPIHSKASKESIPWYDIVLATCSLVIPLYFLSHSYEIMMVGWEIGAPPLPFAFAAILWFLVIEAARRAAGLPLAIVVLFISLYPLWSDHSPVRMLWGPSMSFHKLASAQVISEMGLMGLTMEVFGEIVLGFMVFAVVIQWAGAGNFFTQLASSMVGNMRGGNAKVAVLSSAFFASISGAAVPNVMTTGAFTIPAMKKEGLPSHFAAAVEATASSGGTITPPVMGSAAFLMAEFTGIPYPQIALAAAIPAALYFLCLYSQLDAYAARIKLKPPALPAGATFVPLWKTLLGNFHIILGMGSLVFILFFFRMTNQAPWYAAGITLILALIQNRTRINLKVFTKLIESIGRTLCDLMPMLASIGLIIGALTFTGIALSIPHEIVGIAGDNVVLLLVIGAMTAVILGMGMTTSAVYIFLAIVLAPGLVSYGFDIVAVHLFVIFCGAWSHITPPVALAAYAAASLAEANPIRTGFQAMQLGVAKYILPFIFVTSPALILHGTLSEILWVIPTAAAGLVIIGGGLEGYFWFIGTIRLPARALFVASGFLLVLPDSLTNYLGIGLFLVTFILIKLVKQADSPVARFFVTEQISTRLEPL